MIPQIIAYLVLALLIISFYFSRRLVQINVISYGILVGELYFIFFPLLYFALSKVLEIPFFPYYFDMNIKNETDSMLLLLFYTMALLSVFLFLELSKKKSQNVRNVRVSIRKQKVMYIVFIFLYFILSIYVVFQSNVLDGGDWYRSRGEYLISSGQFGVISFFLIWGLRFLVVAMTFELLSRKAIRFSVAALVVCTISIFELLYVGNRIVVVMFGAAGFMYVYRNFGVKTLVMLIVLLFPIALGLGAYQNVRYLLFIKTPGEVLGQLLSILFQENSIFDIKSDSFILKIFEYADFIVLVRLFNDVGSQIHSYMGVTILKIFSWFIPRSIWAAKPESITLLVGDYYMGGLNVPLVPLFFGEIHYNFGALGILILPLITLFLIRLFEFAISNIRYHYYLSFLIGFMLFRLPISDVVVSIFMALMIYIICSLSINRIFRFR